FVAFGGGLPIDDDGARIGGIGVSGGSEAQDEQCAHAGLAAAGFRAR
ncbi:heme-binding protein, partial [Burkholderia cepacia]|nr:heme-binding protein [Burkholderia cepacia]